MTLEIIEENLSLYDQEHSWNDKIPASYALSPYFEIDPCPHQQDFL